MLPWPLAERDARRRDHGDHQNHGGRGITADTCHGYLPSRIALGPIFTLRLPRSRFIPRKSRNHWAPLVRAGFWFWTPSRASSILLASRLAPLTPVAPEGTGNRQS